MRVHLAVLRSATFGSLLGKVAFLHQISGCFLVGAVSHAQEVVEALHRRAVYKRASHGCGEGCEDNLISWRAPGWIKGTRAN
jgi:hypothetical protein